MSPRHNNCCSKFLWRYQWPSRGLVIRFWAISPNWRDKMCAGAISGGASSWRPAISRHIAPKVLDPVDFFVAHFQRQSRHIVAHVVYPGLTYSPQWSGWCFASRALSSVTEKKLFPSMRNMCDITKNIKTFGLEQNGHHLADCIFSCIFLNETFCFEIKLPNGLFLSLSHGATGLQRVNSP